MEGATSPGTPGAPEVGKGGNDPILEPLEGPQPCATLISGVWSPGLREDELLLFSTTQLVIMLEKPQSSHTDPSL